MSSITSRIIFMGTPDFAVPFLEGLIQAKMKPIAVISQPDRPVGRKQIVEPTPVKKCALSHGIPILQPEDIRTQKWVKKIHEFTPDLIIVVAFGQIIPKAILDIPQKGCVNVHPSLLPKFRGATPLQEAILHGKRETGVTIMLMDEKMDHGPILAQKNVPLAIDETYESLRQKITAIGIPFLIATLQSWLEGVIVPRKQDHEQSTYTRLLTRDNGKIDWSKSAQEIERQVRALNPWPGTWIEMYGKRLKIIKGEAISSDIMVITDAKLGKLVPSIKPGTASLEKIFVPCGDGYFEILELQPEGKKPMTAKEFINGKYIKPWLETVENITW